MLENGNTIETQQGMPDFEPVGLTQNHVMVY